VPPCLKQLGNQAQRSKELSMHHLTRPKTLGRAVSGRNRLDARDNSPYKLFRLAQKKYVYRPSARRLSAENIPS
jgi:hypothetical protein